jgi:methyl-accepting chemotaxis protein
MEHVNDTTNKTNQMKSVAIKTSESAKKGQLLAEKTLKAMQDIYASTNDISKAISVIDAISFQTNILSLNAAVEAATAGEAGKGFAVVAQEVRNLANKSAEAAKKIKELVTKTQVKSNEGIKITDNMKKSFVHVVKNAENTLLLVSNVTKAANEEMKDIESVNELIKGITVMTNRSEEIMKQTSEVAHQLEEISKELYEKKVKKDS